MRVVRAITDVQQVVDRDPRAVDRVAELRRGRRGRVVGTQRHVGRRIAVRAPHALEGAAVGVVDDHAVVAVAVGQVHLVGLVVDVDLRDLAEDVGARAVDRIARRMADLHQKAPALRELQDLPVGRAVPADPDVALGIDPDAVFARRPVIALTRSAPPVDQVAVRREFEDGRRRHAALRARRNLRRAGFVDRQRARSLQHPDVVVRVDRDAADLADEPVVRQLLRPGRIDLVLRHPCGGTRLRVGRDALGRCCARDELAGREQRADDDGLDCRPDDRPRASYCLHGLLPCLRSRGPTREAAGPPARRAGMHGACERTSQGSSDSRRLRVRVVSR